MENNKIVKVFADTRSLYGGAPWMVVLIFIFAVCFFISTVAIGGAVLGWRIYSHNLDWFSDSDMRVIWPCSLLLALALFSLTKKGELKRQYFLVKNSGIFFELNPENLKILPEFIDRLGVGLSLRAADGYVYFAWPELQEVSEKVRTSSVSVSRETLRSWTVLEFKTSIGCFDVDKEFFGSSFETVKSCLRDHGKWTG